VDGSNSNQSSTFWQVEIQCSLAEKVEARKSIALSTRRKFLELKIEVHHFFNVSARNFVVRFQASAASSGRYPSLLLGFSNACPAFG
jgi:hypothetical protein